MTARVEVYAAGSSTVEQTWAVVGDPWRLPAWTDTERVLSVDPTPLEIGTEITLVEAGRRRSWRVITAETQLLEAVSDLGADAEGSGNPEHDGKGDVGQIGIGVRVVADPAGARVILAGAVRRDGLLGAVRARLVDVPALRRRFDAWSQAALRAAADAQP